MVCFILVILASLLEIILKLAASIINIENLNHYCLILNYIGVICSLLMIRAKYI